MLRDVGRVLQLPSARSTAWPRWCRSIPPTRSTLAQAIEIEPRLEEARDEDEAVARLLEIALQLEGLYRHASTHAAGVVIGDRPLTS